MEEERGSKEGAEVEVVITVDGRSKGEEVSESLSSKAFRTIAQAHKFHSDSTLFSTPAVEIHKGELFGGRESSSSHEDGEEDVEDGSSGGVKDAKNRSAMFRKVASVRFPLNWEVKSERKISASMPGLNHLFNAMYPTALHFVSPLNHTEEYWSSRRHRRGRGPKPRSGTKRPPIVWFAFLPYSISFWAEVLFLIGGASFLTGGIFGSIFCFNPLNRHCATGYREALVDYAFIIGSFFFTLGSYFFVLEVLNQARLPTAFSSPELHQTLRKPQEAFRDAPLRHTAVAAVTATPAELEGTELKDSPRSKGETPAKATEGKRRGHVRSRSIAGETPSTLRLILRRPRRVKLWGWKPRTLAYWASLLSLCASSLYLIATSLAKVKAITMASFPYTIAILFIVAGVFSLSGSLVSYFEACHGWFAFKPRSLSWWIVTLRVVGSTLFVVGGIGALFSDPIVIQVVNRVSFMTGGVFFMTATYMGLLEIFNP